MNLMRQKYSITSKTSGVWSINIKQSRLVPHQFQPPRNNPKGHKTTKWPICINNTKLVSATNMEVDKFSSLVFLSVQAFERLDRCFMVVF